MESDRRAHTQAMGSVVLTIGVLLVAVIFAAIFVVMIRASSRQRGGTLQTDFAGRYTFFGFLLGMLRDNDRRRHSGKKTDRLSGHEETDRSSR